MVGTDEFQILVIHKVNFVLVNTVLKSALCQLGMVGLRYLYKHNPLTCAGK